MARSFQGNGDEPITGINVTPLVDIMLVLLIIFMLTARLIYQRAEEKTAIPVDVPAAKTGDPQSGAADGKLGIVVTRDGRLYVNGEETGLEGLKGPVDEAKAAAKRAGTAPVAVITADKEARHGDVIGVMDRLRGLGVHTFAVHTKPVTIDKL